VGGEIRLLRHEALASLAARRCDGEVPAAVRRRLADLLPLAPGETYEGIEEEARRSDVARRRTERAGRRARALAAPEGRDRWLRVATVDLVARLRTLAAAQEQGTVLAMIDEDRDDLGEFAGLAEFALPAAGRRSTPRDIELVASGSTELDSQGVHDDGDYLLRVFLPMRGGGWLGEPPGGFGPGSVDVDRAEAEWCAIAWPKDPALHGQRVYFVDQTGEVWVSTTIPASETQRPTPATASPRLGDAAGWTQVPRDR
jgi:hypothetical protein